MATYFLGSYPTEHTHMHTQRAIIVMKCDSGMNQTGSDGVPAPSLRNDAGPASATHPSVRLSVFPVFPCFCSSVCPSVRRSVCPSFRLPSVRRSVRLSDCPSIRRLSVFRLSIRPSVRPPCSLVSSVSVRLSVRLSVCTGDPHDK